MYHVITKEKNIYKFDTTKYWISKYSSTFEKQPFRASDKGR